MEWSGVCRNGAFLELTFVGRSLQHLVTTVNELQALGVNFQSVQEKIDTTTPGGRLDFHVFAVLAEFERDLIRERTKAGVNAARLCGRRGGRRHTLGEAEAKTLAAMAKQKISTEQICGSVGISRATYFRYLKAAT